MYSEEEIIITSEYSTATDFTSQPSDSTYEPKTSENTPRSAASDISTGDKITTTEDISIEIVYTPVALFMFIMLLIA